MSCALSLEFAAMVFSSGVPMYLRSEGSCIAVGGRCTGDVVHYPMLVVTIVVLGLLVVVHHDLNHLCHHGLP